MIKVDRTNVEYEGTKPVLLAELCMLINDMFDTKEFTKEDFESVIEKACVPREAIFKEAMENIDLIMTSLAIKAALFDDEDAKKTLEQLLKRKQRDE